MGRNFRRTRNDVASSCLTDEVEDGADVALWTATDTGCYQFTTAGSSIEHTLELKDACDAVASVCGEDSQESSVPKEVAADESVIVLIDGTSGRRGF